MSALLLWNLAWSAALAVVVFCLGRLPALQRRPALMHLLWFGVLLRLVVPALVAVPILPDTTATVRVQADFTNALPQNVSVEIVPVEIPEIPQPTAEPIVATDTSSLASLLSLTFVLAAISLSGTLLLITVCLLRSRRIARLLRQSMPAPDALRELTGQLACDMKLQTAPSVRLVEGLATPSISVGLRRATILLPRHLLDELDDKQWSCVLAHELAHLARGDAWFNLAAVGVLLLFWWNPVAWWAWREMRACQEASCDAIALAGSSPSRRQYAETLLQVVDAWTRPSLVQPHALLGFGNRSVLTRRFEMIADSSVRPKTAALAILSLALMAVTFFCLPVRAERKEPAASEKKESTSPEDDEARFLSAVQKAFETRDASGLSALTCWDRVPEKFKQNAEALYAGLVKETNCLFEFKLVEPDRKVVDQVQTDDGLTYRWNLPVTRQLKVICRDQNDNKILLVLNCAVGEKDERLFLAGQASDTKNVAAPIVRPHSITITGTATDATGQPLANAKIYVASVLREDFRRIGETTTDADGKYRLKDFDLPMVRPGNNPKSRENGAFEVFGVADGHGLAWRPAKHCYIERDEMDDRIVSKDRPLIFYADEEIVLNLKFPAAARLSGRVLDEKKQPLRGVGVQIRYCVPLDEPSIPSGDPETFNPNIGLRALTRPEVVPVDVNAQTTDGNGVFQFNDLPVECLIRLELLHPNYPKTQVWMATTDRKLPMLGGESVIYSGSAELQLSAYNAAKAEATVQDKKQPADTILKYDDGKPDGKKSIAGTGEMIHFTAPDANHKLKSLRLHCARYGTSKAPNEDVDISIVGDDEQTVLHTEMVPYSRFKRGESRWTPIEFKAPVEVPEKFWIVVDFNAEQTKGVYLSFDTSTEGKHSKTGVPGGESKPVTTGGDWMIQAVLTKDK